MRIHNVFLPLLLLGIALPARALTVELGVTGGGGPVLAYGSLLDAKAEVAAALGAASPGTAGSAVPQNFPGWTVGVYAETDILSWLALRLDVWYERAGAMYIAFTSGGAPFDQYGVYFDSVNIPLRARAWTPLGRGVFSGSLGPLLGIVTGNITILDRYATSTTTAVVNPDFSHGFFFGLAGGIGYSLRLGPGTAGIELRADWAILPVATAAGQPGGDINPVRVNLVLEYGIQVGGASR